MTYVNLVKIFNIAKDNGRNEYEYKANDQAKA